MTVMPVGSAESGKSRLGDPKTRTPYRGVDTPVLPGPVTVRKSTTPPSVTSAGLKSWLPDDCARFHASRSCTFTFSM
jgi:hypothetical protein